MKVCTKCSEAKPDEDFWWDDGNVQGEAQRCAECRANRRGNQCPACMALRDGKAFSRASSPPRCPEHRGALWVPRERPAIPLKEHAVMRYQQRVRPDLQQRTEVVDLMVAMMRNVPVTDDPPSWYERSATSTIGAHARGYIAISELVILALADYRGRGTMVSTVLTSPELCLPPGEHPIPRWVAATEEQRIQRIVANARRRVRRGQLQPPST